MLCLVSEFIPLSELSIKICALPQDPKHAIATLVRRLYLVYLLSSSIRQKNRGSMRCADVHLLEGLFFRWYLCPVSAEAVVKGQGELHPLRHILHNLFLTSEGILRLARTCSNLSGKGNRGNLVASLFIILPWLNEVDRTLGIENYGSGFLAVRGFVEALCLKNCSTKASFTSKPMIICSLYLGCVSTRYCGSLWWLLDVKKY